MLSFFAMRSQSPEWLLRLLHLMQLLRCFQSEACSTFEIPILILGCVSLALRRPQQELNRHIPSQIQQGSGPKRRSSATAECPHAQFFLVPSSILLVDGTRWGNFNSIPVMNTFVVLRKIGDVTTSACARYFLLNECEWQKQWRCWDVFLWRWQAF